MQAKILMVDDHPLMLEGYKTILSYNDLGYNIIATIALTAESAYNIIMTTHEKIPFDVVFLDYSIPVYEEKNIMSGKDLAILIKKRFPTSRIVMLTSHIEALLIYSIIKEINPMGLLIKSDFSSDELLDAFEAIMKDKVYYSQTVKNIIKEISSKANHLDSINRKILSLLTSGVSTKSIPDILNISLSSVQKRKIIIRDYLGITGGNDEDIIRESKKQSLM
jgi:two-component system, NarL family, response regulator NreC